MENRDRDGRDNRDRDSREGRDNRDPMAEFGDFGGGDDRSEKGGERGGKSGGRGGFNRKKVCPFILDKTLILDYKNIRVVQRFISETGRIVPRHISGVTAKSQRKLTTQIKRARNLGLIAPLIDS